MRREPDGTWLADNFDGAGFVAGLRHAGHDPAGWRVCIVGGGGAGSAIAAALLHAGVAHVYVAEPDGERLDIVVRRLAQAWPGRITGGSRPRLDDVDLVVNATPLGLRDSDPMPFDLDVLRRDAVVADIIMTPARTRLLETAAAIGLTAHPGLPMLAHQIDAYMDFFRLGHRP
jgi:shikimate dehydrogenase